jgi:hypothetical protein
VVVVEVGVDAEEAANDRLDGGVERAGEGDADLGGEDGLVVQLHLDPVHQRVDVFCFVGPAVSGRSLPGSSNGPGAESLVGFL